MKWNPFEVKKSPGRDNHGRFSSDDPLVQVTVSNPIATFQKWVSKLLSNEGVDLKIKIHPLTALAVAGIVAVGGFGIGRFTVPASNPIVHYIPQLAPPPPSPTPDPWRETAFTGMLRYSTVTKKFYLETSNAEAITLEVPTNVTLTKYVGRRIFATGKVNTQSGILFVTEATDLELLPAQQVLIPTVAVSPTATSTPDYSP